METCGWKEYKLIHQIVMSEENPFLMPQSTGTSCLEDIKKQCKYDTDFSKIIAHEPAAKLTQIQ